MTAIWIANRLVKEHARTTRGAFYEVKESFIRSYQDCLTEGRCVRVERRSCRDCGGSGDDGWGWCDRCEGTGIYSERTLFCHYFVIAGRPYSFHSYERPARVAAETGEEEEAYGGRFSEEEIQEFLLPMSGLLRMLRWVAAARGFNKNARPRKEPVQGALEIQVESSGTKFREEDNHPENCFCRWNPRLSRRAV